LSLFLNDYKNIKMNIHFNLRQIEKGQTLKDSRPIFFVYNYSVHGKQKKFVYPTGFKAVPSHWNDKEQRVKNVLAATYGQSTNNFLNALTIKVEKWSVEQQAQMLPINHESLKAFLDDITGKNIAPEKVTLFSFINEFIENSPQRINIHTGKSIAYKTIQKYRTTFEYLKDFQKKQTKITLDFAQMDLKFCERFSSFLTAKQMRPNSVNKHISTLKTFLNEASLQGLQVPNDFKSQNFNVKKVDVNKISLSEKELDLILNYDFTDNPRLEKVRDLFLLGAWTGLRFSDFSTLKPENIKGERIVKEQFKTGAIVTIPILPVVDAILKKYNNVLPKSITNQKTNEYLKEVCQLVGLTERIEIVETRGGVKQTEIFEKWQLVSTHTARRSFATNMYQMGVPSRAIMAVTGHKTELAFNKYIKIDGAKYADMLEDAFNKEPTQTLKLKKTA
jgi:site-specific recombinase XerD